MPDLVYRLQNRLAGVQNSQRIARLNRAVAEQEQPQPNRPPVVVFNASTRLTGLSLNAAFSLITSWGLRLAGAPVKHFVCRSGMSHCVLGIDRQDFSTPPPCERCISQSERLYQGAGVHWFEFGRNEALAAALEGLSVPELSAFSYPFRLTDGEQVSIPLGELVLPALRWTLRRHHIPDTAEHRYLLREYLLSAYSVACDFAAFLDDARPAALVLFNAVMYPEATARWVARQRDLRVISHEVGFQRYSAFFTEGHPTAYPIRIPDDFELSEDQNARLDAYLEQRFQGKFTMAGIRFWPEMRGLDEDFLQKAAGFRQIVPVFTNVIYDTSQLHANVIFPHMMAWLDLVLEIIRDNPDTLFVIRAHPDEMRPNSAKHSNESVRDWTSQNGVDRLPNVVFIDSQEYISSYELIQRAKFVMVYNSSIGLEAALMGAPVLCGGKARYTQYPIVFMPPTPEEYRRQAEAFLGGERVEMPPEFGRNARRFLYYQLYRVSLPFDDFIEAGPRQGFVRLKAFDWQDLLPERSETMRVLLDGILRESAPANRAGPFTLTLPE